MDGNYFPLPGQGSDTTSKWMSEGKKRANCNHFVARKNRFCHGKADWGKDYCGPHQRFHISEDPNETGDNSKIKVVCPFDRKHTCYADELKKHLEICNARQTTVNLRMEPYISKGINAGEKISDDYEGRKPLSAFSVPDLKNVILKVNEIFERLIKGKISEKILSHSDVEELLSKRKFGKKPTKELKQSSAILGLLDEYEIMKRNTCYIEFGTGTDQLGDWIAEATKHIEGSTTLIVERPIPLYKREIKPDNVGDTVQRIKADISDLVLDKLEAVSNTENLVVVSKYLCSAETDMALRCLANVEENKKKVAGAVLNSCCHHDCIWSAYTGKHFFEDNKLSQKDFVMICSMARWATDGLGLSRDKNEVDFKVINLGDGDTELKLTHIDREEVGRRCKNVLNWGRLVYLEKLGFSCILHYYINRIFSLENVCIVAYNPAHRVENFVSNFY